MTVLVTGGAGFIGSRLVARLAADYDRIVVLDNLHPQVHGPHAMPPVFPANAVFLQGSIDDRAAVVAAIDAADPRLVFHLAAETGTGQSYDEIARYTAVNISGTAILIEELRRRAPKLQRAVLAGSRSVYGEGLHRRGDGSFAVPAPRTPERMAAGDFQPRDGDGAALEPVATPETAPPQPSSVYASTKLMQEYLFAQGFAGTAVSPVVLRFQNVYGPGQSLRNPYTGVLSIFCAQILAGATLDIYEDGAIARDFVFVDDVVEALCLAGSAAAPGSDPINVGSGEAATILATAETLLGLLGADRSRREISGKFRAGDVRCAVADITRAEQRLAWRPKIDLATGLAALAAWARETRSTMTDG